MGGPAADNRAGSQRGANAVDIVNVDHKLVVAWLTEDASYINQTYRNKLQGVKKAETDADWGLYVDLHERPYRLCALLSATKKGLKDKPSEFWELVGNVWRDSENIHHSLSKWRGLWGTPIGGRRACMSAEDLLIFELAARTGRSLARHGPQTWCRRLVVARSGKGCLVRTKV